MSSESKSKQKLSEQEVMSALKNNDRRAFDYIFNEFYQALYYFTQKLIDNTQEAEDIVSQTFQTFFAIKDNFDTLVNVKAFLYITARNRSFDLLRHKQRLATYQKELALIAGKSREEQAADVLQIQSELLRMINKEVEKLPEKYRNVFELSFFGELSNEEIAQRLHISVTNVTSIKSRAVKKLRLQLLEKGLLSLFLFLINNIPHNQGF
jgi:RNA polymerase sigma-70 factor (ECF subfamily)